MRLSKEDQLIRSSEAERLLNNSLLQETVIAVRANLYHTIENSRWTQRRMREDAYKQLKSLNAVMGAIEKEAKKGKLAANQLERESKNK